MRNRSRRSKTATRREVAAYARHALAANGFGDAAIDLGPQQAPFRARPRRAARRWSPIIEAILTGVHSLVRPVVAWWRRRQQASATYLALQALDARALRDLGFDRSEISSVAAEIAGDAARTRARTVRRLQRPFR